ncbi:hypothetical protein OKA04_02415 [Luteolibacter flavescens]|uniref:Uncharacterized protein n=1 Tax=Luteolibacter flavescens TaxID=1859460 RepID=A0ABT3FJ15_9BACT|nr:hypothetical protein [Luteolibacter flavescens]MCW1883563.1 hypothetical protein [Luteolibacter flavescens]
MSASLGFMRIRNDIITRIEFVGGPEDGRILELDELPVPLATGEDREGSRVPMLLALDNQNRRADEGEFVVIILGHYVSHRSEGNCAKFDWFPLR